MIGPPATTLVSTPPSQSGLIAYNCTVILLLFIALYYTELCCAALSYTTSTVPNVLYHAVNGRLRIK